MTLTPERRAELRAKAEAATPGPWYAEDRPSDYDVTGWCVKSKHQWSPDGSTETYDSTVSDACCCCCGSTLLEPEDAAHIAAFDPPTVLALLDHITALEAALRPFGDCAWDGGQDDGVAILRRDGTELTVGDFRRAASLLPGEGNA